MREAVIVSTARTPIGRAYGGAFNDTEAPTLAAHSLRHAVERAGVEPAEVEDVIIGCANPQGGKRRGARHVVNTMCVGGGMGAAGLFEVA